MPATSILFRRVAAVCLALMLSAGRGEPTACADEPAPGPSGQAASKSEPAGDASHSAPVDGDGEAAADHAGEPQLDPRKERVATAAVWLLAGVAFVGAMLIGLVVLWGFHVRRLAREPLPKTARSDEFWYLRPKAGLPKSRPSTGAADPHAPEGDSSIPARDDGSTGERKSDA